MTSRYVRTIRTTQIMTSRCEDEQKYQILTNIVENSDSVDVRIEIRTKILTSKCGRTRRKTQIPTKRCVEK